MDNIAGMIASLIALDPATRLFGSLHTSLNYVSIVGTDNTLVLTAPTGGTLRAYAIWVHNRNAAAVTLTMGTGATLTQRVPLLGPFLTGFSDIVPLPLCHFESSIYITSSAGAAAPNDVQVQVFAIAVGA